MRALRGGDVRAVYYSVLALAVVWGIVALRLAQPIVLLKLGANGAVGPAVLCDHVGAERGSSVPSGSTSAHHSEAPGNSH